MKSYLKIVVGTLLVSVFMPMYPLCQQKRPEPALGFIPDKATAVQVAEAILVPIYGKQMVESERPFSAILKGNTWKVEGYLAPGVDGGVSEVWLDRRDGKILRVSQGK